jgi:hypothetical protein
MMFMYDHQLISGLISGMSPSVWTLEFFTHSEGEIECRSIKLGTCTRSFLPVFTDDLNHILWLHPSPLSDSTSYLTHSLCNVSDTVSLLLTLMTSPSDDDLLLSDPQFAGLFQSLSMDKDAGDIPSAAEIVDDYEGEQETIDLQSGTCENGEDDADDDSEDEDDEDDEESVGFLALKDVVKNASKGVTEGTDSEYRRSEYTYCPSFFSDSLPLAKWPSALSSWCQRGSFVKMSHSSVQHPVPMHRFSSLRGLWMGT